MKMLAILLCMVCPTLVGLAATGVTWAVFGTWFWWPIIIAATVGITFALTVIGLNRYNNV